MKFQKNKTLSIVIATLVIFFNIKIIFSNSDSSATVTTNTADYEAEHYNATGVCESVEDPESEDECFKQTNKTHSCCMVKINGTYKDPTIYDLYPAAAAHRLRTLRLLGATAAASDSHSSTTTTTSTTTTIDPHATAATTTDSHATTSATTTDPHATTTDAHGEVVDKNERKICYAVPKGEKVVTGVMRKLEMDDHLINAYFVCNTTQKIKPCGMSNPSKFADCKTHSRKSKKCCLIEYEDLKTCGLSPKLGDSDNNTNHLHVKFTCKSNYFELNAVFLLILNFLFFI